MARVAAQWYRSLLGEEQHAIYNYTILMVFDSEQHAIYNYTIFMVFDSILNNYTEFGYFVQQAKTSEQRFFFKYLLFIYNNDNNAFSSSAYSVLILCFKH